MCVGYSVCQFLGCHAWNRKPKEQNALLFAFVPRASCIVNAEWRGHSQTMIFNDWRALFLTLIHLLLLCLTHCLFSFVLLQFFMLILLIFLAELAAAILAFIFREHVSCRSIRYTSRAGCQIPIPTCVHRKSKYQKMAFLAQIHALLYLFFHQRVSEQFLNNFAISNCFIHYLVSLYVWLFVLRKH